MTDVAVDKILGQEGTFDKSKPTILVCTDSPVVNTGFGKVCRNLVVRWVETGKYNIVCMGTNDRAEHSYLRGMVDKGLIIEPLPDIPGDPYGMHRMPELLEKYQPDLVFSLNDIWVWTGDERHPQMDNWFYKHLKAYRPYVPWVGYFPVDGRLWDQKWVDMANKMDYATTFTDYGFKVLNETPGIDTDKVRAIYHGHDTQNMFPVSDEKKFDMRRKMGVPDDALLIGVVGRNQPRKGIPFMIYAFKMFKDGYVKCDKCNSPRSLDVFKDCELCGSYGHIPGHPGNPNSYLYLHMNPLDLRGYRLPKIQKDNKCGNIIQRMNHDVAMGVPIEELNVIYNALDISVNPAMAGGYELTVAESLSAGTPTVATRSTSMIEQLNDGKGWLVQPIAHMVMEDASHTPKHIIDVQGLIDTLQYIKDNPEEAEERSVRGMAFSHERNWDDSADQFVELFDKCLEDRVELDTKLKKSKTNVSFINDSDDFGSVMSMMPALHKLAKQRKELNISVAVNKRMKPILSGMSKEVDIFEVEKLWLDKEKLSKFQLQVQPLKDVPHSIEQASLQLKVEPPSYAEAYAKGLNAPVDFKHISDLYRITKEEREEAKKVLEEYDGQFNTLFFVDTISQHAGIPPATWSKLLKFFEKMGTVTKVGIANDFELEAIEGFDMNIGGATLRQLIALIAEADCVVTNIDAYGHVANFVDTPFVLIESTKPLGHFMKHSTAMDRRGKKSINQCVRNTQGGPVANIGPGDIFMGILNVQRDWEARLKDEKGKVEASAKNESPKKETVTN
jgi:glycosyltransferase involved in cell wall biosynthesis/ADP-heptose:LPS heptosyltransferase